MKKRKDVILKTLLVGEILSGRGLLKGKGLRTRDTSSRSRVARNNLFVNRYWVVLFESKEDLPQRVQRTQSGGMNGGGGQ